MKSMQHLLRLYFVDHVLSKLNLINAKLQVRQIFVHFVESLLSVEAHHNFIVRVRITEYAQFAEKNMKRKIMRI